MQRWQGVGVGDHKAKEEFHYNYIQENTKLYFRRIHYSSRNIFHLRVGWM